jgi:type I restriction-modification system DNA methylase subunit
METKTQYITIREAAKLLDITPATLRNWDKLGKLVPHRDPINGYRLYSIEDISRLIQETSYTYQTRPVVTATQQTLFPITEKRPLDLRGLRLLIRQMSQAFRDSMGGGLLERFEEISKLLYCKFYDERQLEALNGYSSQFYRKPGETQEETYQRIINLYTQAIKLLPEVFTNGNRQLSEDKHAVARVVEILQDTCLGDIPADVKGAVYETLIQNTFEKSDNQQFFTPRSVVEFMVRFINPDIGQTLCDPACGSGGFLIEAAKYIAKKVGDEQKLSEYLSKHMLGLEIDRRMAWVAQMNMIMHGDGYGNIHHLSGNGSLSSLAQLEILVKPNSLDLILTNPPFGSDLTDRRSLAGYQLGRDKASRRRGILFIERSVDWLKPGGRLGIIIEDSVLNGASNKDVRHFILQRCIIEAIISLPDVTFMPYASAKTSILFLRKRSSPESQPPIFMAEVENVGRKPNGDPLYDTKRNYDGEYQLLNELPEVVNAWQTYNRKGEKAIAHLSPKVFICPFKRPQDFKQDIRLDVQYHHPSCKVAEETLYRSTYPTPKLAELVVLRNETAIPARQDPDEFWRYVGLANITSVTGEYTVSHVAGSQIKSTVRLFRSKDILFSKLRPELRKVVLIREDDDEGYASSECLVLCTVENARGDSSLWKIAQGRKSLPVDHEYLAFILRSDIIFGQLVYQITGIGRPRVSKSAILNLRIPLPPLEIQREIVAGYKTAWKHYLESRRRSELALREGEMALQSAYEHASERLCPLPL